VSRQGYDGHSESGKEEEFEEKKKRNPCNDEEKDTYSIINLLSSITTNCYCQEQEAGRNV